MRMVLNLSTGPTRQRLQGQVLEGWQTTTVTSHRVPAFPGHLEIVGLEWEREDGMIEMLCFVVE